MRTRLLVILVIAVSHVVILLVNCVADVSISDQTSRLSRPGSFSTRRRSTANVRFGMQQHLQRHFRLGIHQELLQRDLRGLPVFVRPGRDPSKLQLCKLQELRQFYDDITYFCSEKTVAIICANQAGEGEVEEMSSQVVGVSDKTAERNDGKCISRVRMRVGQRAQQLRIV